jgi:hypothetical protein
MKTDPAISRLRAANPFPGTTAEDGADLFAQITALAPDPELRARRAGSRRPRMVLALALLGAAFLASTAFAISSWVHGAVKPPVTRAEYRHAQRALTLPPGVTWPALHVPSDSVTSMGAGGGHAVLIAQNAWECYWVRAIHAGDVAAQHRAHQALDNLIANHVVEAPPGAAEDWTPSNPGRGPYAIFAHDGGLAWVQAGYRQAAAGHPEQLAATCRANGPVR